MRRTRRLTAAGLAALVAAVALLTGCGSGGSSGSGELTVSAAASLKPVFSKLGGARFQFGGSDILAAQIEQGARPDVYAAANTKLPAMLYAKHLVERPVPFVSNELVIAIPAGSRIRTLADLERPGVKLVIGSPSVPVGAYTRTVLGRLPAAERTAILRNVRSQEPDVSGIVGKLTQGAADAGFTYITDVAATHHALGQRTLPAGLRPRVVYAAAVVRGTHRPGAAHAFLASLTGGTARRALYRAGFHPPTP